MILRIDLFTFFLSDGVNFTIYCSLSIGAEPNEGTPYRLRVR